MSLTMNTQTSHKLLTPLEDISLLVVRIQFKTADIHHEQFNLHNINKQHIVRGRIFLLFSSDIFKAMK